MSPVNQRTYPEQAQDPPKTKPQTPQPETKPQVLTGAQFTQGPPEANCPIFPPETPAVTIKAPLKFNCPPNESLGNENKPLLDKDIMPHIFSAGSPDKESRCCDKPNETGSTNDSPLAKTPRITHGLPQTVPERKATPCETLGLRSIVTVLPDLLRPVRTGGGREMYNVANSIITDRKMLRCIFKVSFYFSGSLYETHVLLTLFLQIELSIPTFLGRWVNSWSGMPGCGCSCTQSPESRLMQPGNHCR